MKKEIHIPSLYIDPIYIRLRKAATLRRIKLTDARVIVSRCIFGITHDKIDHLFVELEAYDLVESRTREHLTLREVDTSNV